ncbi:hypothetical protein B0J14DRAFT_678566 [Halenospora varia]|nr:hypothetical protein B0J14DRAFT_678566 [Halenospora varia]
MASARDQLSGVVGQIQTAVWKVPDGKLENFSQTFFQGQTLAVSWNGWTQVVGGVLDATKSLTDLWVTAFDSAQNPYNELIKSNINLTSTGTLAWPIAIPPTTLTIDARYVLRFKPNASTFDPNSLELSSPGFLVLNSVSSSSSSLTTTTSSSSTTANALDPSISLLNSQTGLPSLSTNAPSSTSSATIVATPQETSGLSSGAKAGLGIGITAAILGIVGAGYFIWRMRQKKKTSIESMAWNGAAVDHVEDKNAVPPPMYSGSPAVELPGGTRSDLPISELDGNGR